MPIYVVSALAHTKMLEQEESAGTTDGCMKTEWTMVIDVHG